MSWWGSHEVKQLLLFGVIISSERLPNTQAMSKSCAKAPVVFKIGITCTPFLRWRAYEREGYQKMHCCMLPKSLAWCRWWKQHLGLLGLLGLLEVYLGVAYWNSYELMFCRGVQTRLTAGFWHFLIMSGPFFPQIVLTVCKEDDGYCWSVPFLLLAPDVWP